MRNLAEWVRVVAVGDGGLYLATRRGYSASGGDLPAVGAAACDACRVAGPGVRRIIGLIHQSLRRHAINSSDRPPDHPPEQPRQPLRRGLKRKGFWALPAIIAVTAVYQIFDLELRLPVPQHWLLNAIASAINDQLDDRRLIAYITLAAGAFAYWLARENALSTVMEVLRMGIRTFIREIKQEIRDEAKAEGRAVGRDEGRDEGRAEILDELRAMPPHEVLARLGHRNGDPELERPDNGKSELEQPNNGKSPQD